MMMLDTNEQPTLFRPGTEKHRPSKAPVALNKPVDTHSGTGEFLLCRACMGLVTSASEKIEVNGAHTHSFANPHGLFFDIGCFCHAPGCAYSSESSYEFTWFAGFHWQIAVCRACMAHLGWLFTSSGRRFNGLILDKLIAWNSRDERPS
ncbi:MAG: hypothetical protein KKD44_15915 [Proteobacteria bacterium]|nr:hypothetical protein [Pseudomonadota bacterium]